MKRLFVISLSVVSFFSSAVWAQGNLVTAKECKMVITPGLSEQQCYDCVSPALLLDSCNDVQQTAYSEVVNKTITSFSGDVHEAAQYALELIGRRVVNLVCKNDLTFKTYVNSQYGYQRLYYLTANLFNLNRTLENSDRQEGTVNALLCQYVQVLELI
ncbi:MAG: hypothetical protein JXA66_02335, partial [Oligoflexia bacterium]|nr:hypothetical protein [Oligoflexia bacterium]